MIDSRSRSSFLRSRRDGAIDLLFLVPTLAVLACFLFYPLAYGVVLSLHETGRPRWPVCGPRSTKSASQARADVQVEVGQGQVALVAAGEGAVGVESLEVELDRPLRQDLGAAGGDEGRHDRVEAVAARVAAASTRSQVNIAIRRIR